MFERLTESLQLTFRRFKGKVTINEQDIHSMVADLKAALLDADVHLSVIDEIVAESSKASSQLKRLSLFLNSI